MALSLRKSAFILEKLISNKKKSLIQVNKNGINTYIFNITICL